MKLKLNQPLFLSWVLLFCFCHSLSAQVCTAPGQTPASAVLVCGSNSYTVTTSTFCGQNSIPIPCSDGYPYKDKNPNFFRMNCFMSGTLGFTILPDDPSANYSWSLWDVTNTNPNDVFTNSTLLVACNWSGDGGETGASVDGTNLIVCSGAQPLFSKMPDIVAGKTYLLMVANESGSAGSYQLTFQGGSASITDAIEPAILKATPSCDKTSLVVRFTKRMLCNSVAADGSDFIVNNTVVVTGAYMACGPFGNDSVVITFSQPLNDGNYNIKMNLGSDGNTVFDLCGREISETENMDFTVAPLQPTPMDSIKPVGCTPGFVELVFKRPIDCSSIASDGSDFAVTGPQAISLIPSCSSGYSSIIKLDFSTSSVLAGNYQVTLVRGADGNTLLDQCGLESPAGATLSFEVKEFVSALFTYDIPPTCKETVVSFFHDGAHNVNQWTWNFGAGLNSALQNPVQVFSKPGNHIIKLTVSNGSCTDTHSDTIVTGAFLTASFEIPKMACPGDTLSFSNTSTGTIDHWSWDFGNGMSSTDKIPKGFKYPDIGRDNYYTIRLGAINSAINCGDTASQVIKVLSNCKIGVPSAFTPNGDGRNDFLYPLNALKADNLDFRVYNRMGQLIFQTKDWTSKWDGNWRGERLPTGLYVWLLNYTDRDNKQKIFRKGTVMLIR